MHHTPSIFSHSLGANVAGHTLPHKLRAAAEAGFKAIELFQDDLDAFVTSDDFAVIYDASTPPESPQSEKAGLHGQTTSSSSASSSSSSSKRLSSYNAHGRCSSADVERELAAATYVRNLANSLGLTISSLQPLRDFEGWLDAEKRSLAIERGASRFAVAHALGTDLVMICSNCSPREQLSGEVDDLARDLAELADRAVEFGRQHPEIDEAGLSQERPMRVAYEALAWGSHVDNWEKSWAVVQRANRSNVGLLIDSFNLLGRSFADPTTSSGMLENPSPYPALTASLELLSTVPASKIFFLQLADAHRMASGPLAPSPSPTEPRPARQIWSRASRLYPCETALGAFMPVTDVVRAVQKAGYRGPWSLEVFHESLNVEGDGVVERHARRGIQSLRALDQIIYADAPTVVGA